MCGTFGVHVWNCTCTYPTITCKLYHLKCRRAKCYLFISNLTQDQSLNPTLTGMAVLEMYLHDESRPTVCGRVHIPADCRCDEQTQVTGYSSFLPSTTITDILC